MIPKVGKLYRLNIYQPEHVYGIFIGYCHYSSSNSTILSSFLTGKEIKYLYAYKILEEL